MEASSGLAHQALQLPDGAWTHGPAHLARGRSAKDPSAQTATFTVDSIEAFESSLRQYLDDPPPDPEHAEGHFTFWIGTSFLVAPPGLSTQERVALEAHQRREQQQQQNAAPPPTYPPPSLEAHYAVASQAHQIAQNAQNIQNAHNEQVQSNGASAGPGSSTPQQPQGRVSMSIMEALAPTANPKERMRKQRAIAKTCVDSIQKVDGYRYSFHNNWNSREDDAFRFSYYCNDSLLNKDRAANGKGQKVGKRATKPVYDCRGVIAVKFSYIKSTLDIHYKHIPKHKTYEERAPPPRRDSKRRKWLEEHDPEAIPQKKPRRECGPVDPNVLAAPPKKKKTVKKNDNKDQPADSIESSLRAQSLQSLLELIRVDQTASNNENASQASPSTPAINGIQLNQQHNIHGANGIDSSQPVKRRPRSSCENCRVKRIKCDNARPICKSCVDKNQQCIYSDSLENGNRPSHPGLQATMQTPTSDTLVMDVNTKTANQASQQVEIGASEAAMYAQMKAELEAAKQEIAMLKADKIQSPSTMQTMQPVQTPSLTPKPNMTPLNNVPALHQHRSNRESIPFYQQQLQASAHVQSQPRNDGYVQQQAQAQTQHQPQQPHHNHMSTNQHQHQHQHQHQQQPQQPQWTWPANQYGYQPATMQPPRPEQWGNPSRTGSMYRG